MTTCPNLTSSESKLLRYQSCVWTLNCFLSDVPYRSRFAFFLLICPSFIDIACECTHFYSITKTLLCSNQAILWLLTVVNMTMGDFILKCFIKSPGEKQENERHVELGVRELKIKQACLMSCYWVYTITLYPSYTTIVVHRDFYFAVWTSFLMFIPVVYMFIFKQ